MTLIGFLSVGAALCVYVGMLIGERVGRDSEAVWQYMAEVADEYSGVRFVDPPPYDWQQEGSA